MWKVITILFLSCTLVHAGMPSPPQQQQILTPHASFWSPQIIVAIIGGLGTVLAAYIATRKK